MTRQGGFGAVLKITVNSSLTAVANVEDFEFPEFEKVLKEVTNHGSPGGYAEYLDSGKRKANSFECTLTWDVDEQTHQAMLTAFDGTDPVEMSTEDPDGTEVISFDAHIQKMGRITGQEDAYQAKVTIQPTGLPQISNPS